MHRLLIANILSKRRELVIFVNRSEPKTQVDLRVGSHLVVKLIGEGIETLLTTDVSMAPLEAYFSG